MRYLDGLRGIAILAVLTVHTGQLVVGLSQPVRDLTFYGVRGVQLFFIVSGLTLTLNYARRPFHGLNFAARRFFRIAPMFYIGVVLYLTLAYTTSPDLPARSASVLDVAATLIFLHGWLPSAINTVVPGGWSIAAEAMFYVIFPLILLTVKRPRRLAVFVVASYIVAAATNFALRRLLTGDSGATMAFSFWLVQLPAFASGCLLATIATRPPAMRWATPVLCAAVIGLLIDSQLRGRSNLLVAILLLTLATWAAGIVRPRILEGRMLPLLGEISFSFYIAHFAVLSALHPLATAIERAIGPYPAFVVLFATALIIAGAISWCSYRWIERPVIRATRRIGLAQSAA